MAQSTNPLTPKERERLTVIEQLLQGKLTNSEAAGQLHLSTRQVIRLKESFRTDGVEGLIHRLKGARSNRRYSLTLRTEVLRLFHDCYSDYGPTFFSETLRRHHQISVSREWLRQLLLAKGLWKGERKSRKHRKKRPRKQSRGMLIQFDGSDHLWFEDRAERCTLLLSIDDATNDAEARFVRQEDAQEVLSFWRDYTTRHGIPRAIYTDFHSVYYNNQHPERLTDFGRALKTLNIEHIKAYSAQAKGRVERAFRTFQDWLVKELRRVGISTITEANRYLQKEFLPAWRIHNAETLGIKRVKNVHRRCVLTPEELNTIFCFQQERFVYNDYTIMLTAVSYQLMPSEATPLPLPRSKVIVRQYLDGSLHIVSPTTGTELNYHVFPSSPSPAAKKKVIAIPAADHPWRHKPIMGQWRALRSRSRKKKRNG